MQKCIIVTVPPPPPERYIFMYIDSREVCMLCRLYYFLLFSFKLNRKYSRCGRGMGVVKLEKDGCMYRYYLVSL